MKRFLKWVIGIFLVVWVGLWAGLRIADHRSGNHLFRAMADRLIFKRTKMICPTGALEDGRGNLLISDLGGALWRRSPEGNMDVVAGPPSGCWFTDRNVWGIPKDGVGAEAVLSDPRILAVDPLGNAYLEETELSEDPEKVMSLVCKVTPEGKVTTLARNSMKAEPQLFLASGAAAAADGTLYLALGAECSSLWKLNREGRFEHLAGSDKVRGYQDGALSEARFDWLGGLAMDRSGSLYIGDLNNRVIRKLDTAGQVTTMAGTPGQKGKQDGDRQQSRLMSPMGLCMAADGELRITDGAQGLVRRITPTGEVHTLVSSFGRKQMRVFPIQLSEDRSGDLILFSNDPLPYLLQIKPSGEVVSMMDFGKSNVAVF